MKGGVLIVDVGFQYTKLIAFLHNMRVKPAQGEEYSYAKIVNEVKGINRVVCGLTFKTPGTIEWE